MKYSIPYGKGSQEFDVRGARVVFSGEMTHLPGISDIRAELFKSLDFPIASKPFSDLASGKKNIVLLVEDNTRSTPLDVLLPMVLDYLNGCGVPDEAVTLLTAPGTHRMMTDVELLAKLGADVMQRVRVVQHDAADKSSMEDLGEIDAGGYALPVRINRLALEADLLVGVGSIVPHSDAGFSGGAKIVQPGVCDFVTTQATHRAAGFCTDIPLGMEEGNPCREGIDAVGRIAGLAFIINIVKNYNGQIAGIFCGDYMKAHREGVKLAKKSFSVEMDELADIVVASSSPADMDYWQGIKGLTAAYFAVKQGGTVILAAPCPEGLAHNHPLYARWLASSIGEITEGIKNASPYDLDTDVISAVVALGSRRVLARAKVYIVSEGLTKDDITSMGCVPAVSIQDALDDALAEAPGSTVGILPKGGIALPVLKH